MPNIVSTDSLQYLQLQVRPNVWQTGLRYGHRFLSAYFSLSCFSAAARYRENLTVNAGIHSTNLTNAPKHIYKVADQRNDTAKTNVYIVFPAILVLVNSPIGRSGFVAVLSCKVRIFEYPHAPHTKERVSCEIRSNAMLPPVAHLGIGHLSPV